MTVESDEYEKFIAKLISDISGTHRDIQFLCSGAKCRPTGNLGQKHQTDVAFIDRTFTPPKLVLIECKLKNEKYHVGPEAVKILSFNGVDLAKSQKYPDDYLLIICSTSDFTSGAKKLAEALDIKLEKVTSPLDYTFRYENIISAGISSTVGLGDFATAIIRHVDGTED